MKFFHRLISLESLFVVLVVSGAGFLRLYRIGDYLTFLGDEGRDVLVVRDILLGDLTLLGPRASAGDFFLGPIYYYFMAPFLWLWNFDPIGPAIMIGIIGTATVWLIYFVGKQFFGSVAALFAGALYAVSPVVIAYSRSSWNPNPMPFLSLIILFLLYKAVAEEKRRLYILIGVLFGTTMQLHYLATFLGVIILVYLFTAHWMRDRKKVFQSMLYPLSRMFIGFLIGFSPFLVFEVRHGFPNFRTILGFIFTNTFSSGYKTGMAFQDVLGNVFFRLFGRLITRFPPPEQVSVQTNQGIALWYYATVILAIVSTGIFAWQFYKYYKKKDEKKILQYSLIALWFFLGIILFGFYKKPIHDYYFGFMFPAPFLLLGNAVATLVKSKRLNIIGVILGLFVFCWLLLFNLKGAPFLSSPNRQKDQVKMIAEFVIEKAGGKPFNFALLTNGNSDHAYRYFFELAGKPPVTIENETIDPQRKTVTDQLLIICEDRDCRPLGNSLWEVAGFGRAEIVDEWSVSVVKVYKLSHYTGE